MKYLLPISLLVVSLLTTACTTRAAYEAVRQNERSVCERKASESERAECLARVQDDYDTYTEKRRAVTNEDKQGAQR